MGRWVGETRVMEERARTVVDWRRRVASHALRHEGGEWRHLSLSWWKVGLRLWLPKVVGEHGGVEMGIERVGVLEVLKKGFPA